jgi:ParB family chromosome partitioning protein
MDTVEIPVDKLREAAWNPNRMDHALLERLKASIERYGLVQNLVVRPNGDDSYEVLSGNQRLRLLLESGAEAVPCVVVELDDAQARLLAQALNHIRGQDDLGQRAALMRDVLKTMTEDQVLSILPEGATGLSGLASLGQETMAEHLEKWERTRPARLKHLLFQLTPAQLAVVQQALQKAGPLARKMQGDSPNARGISLFVICRAYLDGGGQP